MLVPLCPLVERHNHFGQKLRTALPHSWEIEAGYVRTVWSGLRLSGGCDFSLGFFLGPSCHLLLITGGGPGVHGGPGLEFEHA